MKRFFSQLNYYLAKVYMPIWKFLVWLYEYMYYALFPRFKLTVSYNAVFGDADDRDYIVKKFHKTILDYFSIICILMLENGVIYNLVF